MANVIQDDIIKDTKENLIKFIPKWALRLSELISEDNEWKEHSSDKITETNVRNIGHNHVKSQLHRRLFLKYATVLIKREIKKSKETQELLSQVTEEITAE